MSKLSFRRFNIVKRPRVFSLRSYPLFTAAGSQILGNVVLNLKLKTLALISDLWNFDTCFPTISHQTVRKGRQIKLSERRIQCLMREDIHSGH
jgi:hypothetical protein